MIQEFLPVFLAVKNNTEMIRTLFFVRNICRSCVYACNFLSSNSTRTKCVCRYAWTHTRTHMRMLRERKQIKSSWQNVDNCWSCVLGVRCTVVPPQVRSRTPWIPKSTQVPYVKRCSPVFFFQLSCLKIFKIKSWKRKGWTQNSWSNKQGDKKKRENPKFLFRKKWSIKESE